MKVLMFGWEYPPRATGGLGTATDGLTRHLSEAGHDVTLVLPKVLTAVTHERLHLKVAPRMTRWVTVEEAPDTSVTTVAIDSPLGPYMGAAQYRLVTHDLHAGPRGRLKLASDYGEDLFTEVERYTEAASFFVESEDFDVIHAHDWMTFRAAARAKKLSGKPLVVHVHSTEYDRNGDRADSSIVAIEREGMHAADKVIAVSERLKAQLVARYGLPPSRIEVVHNGVAPVKGPRHGEVKKALDEKFVLFLGRLVDQKGPEYFVRAAALVASRMKKVRFVMAGSGEKLPAMVESIARLGLPDRFHFTGHLEGDELDQLYAMGDLLVMPSKSEPFGLVAMEAAQRGVPVVVSKDSGVLEVLPGAVPVDIWNETALAEIIIDLLKNPRKARQLAKKNEDAVAKSTWSLVAEKVTGVYNGLFKR